MADLWFRAGLLCRLACTGTLWSVSELSPLCLIARARAGVMSLSVVVCSVGVCLGGGYVGWGRG